jgi:hypothetical protein
MHEFVQNITKILDQNQEVFKSLLNSRVFAAKTSSNPALRAHFGGVLPHEALEYNVYRRIDYADCRGAWERPISLRTHALPPSEITVRPTARLTQI